LAQLWKRFLPQTLVGRTLLVLLTALIITQGAGVVLFLLAHQQLAAQLDSRQSAERIASIVQVIEQTPSDDRGRLAHGLDRPGLKIGWGKAPILAPGIKYTVDTQLENELTRRLPGRVLHAGLRTPVPQLESGPQQGSGFGGRGNSPTIQVAVTLEDGTWLNFVIPLPPDERLWRPHPYWPLGIGLLVVVVLCVILVRHAVRPLTVLTKAADRLGRDVLAPPVEISGPREVMAAANAFNRMQTRIRRFIEDRTQMIAAISHDLRTPITRLKLRAEFIEDDEQRLKILADLDEMEAMISSTLAFARDDSARETKVLVDLVGLLVDLCDQFRVALDGPDELEMSLGANGIKRAFANLIENACKYGGGARVAVKVVGDMAEVTIDDDGPGIPVAELENVFAPFYRVESSRNRETGGTGLGLAVARSAVRANGGDITLANRQGGGLTVTVTLPV
jgi:signal transduction histidine kinase